MEDSQKPYNIKLLEDKIAKLKRNLDQMSAEQLIQYEQTINKIKREIRTSAGNIYREYITGGEIFRHSDEDSQKSIKSINDLLKSSEDIGFKGAAIDYIFEAFDLDRFLVAICPLFYKCFFDVYGKQYWLKKIKLIDGMYYTDVIDMWWEEKTLVWKKRDGNGNLCQPFMIMIPPREDMLEEAYKKSIEAYTASDSEWRQKIPFIYSEKFVTLFPEFLLRQEQISMDDLFGKGGV